MTYTRNRSAGGYKNKGEVGATPVDKSEFENFDGGLAALSAAVYGGSLSAFGYLSVKDATYGAKGDGVSDDTVAIQAAVTAAQSAGGGTVYLPGGGGVVYKVTTNIAMGRNVSVMIGQGATVKATSAITGGIFQWPSTAPFTKDCGAYGPGVIDCNDLAEMGVQFRYYDHVYINGGLSVINSTKDAVKLGDSGAFGNSAEAFVGNLHTGRTQGTLVSGSSGIRTENSSDNSFKGVVCQNSFYGLQLGGAGNNTVDDVHCWGDTTYGNMDTCFDVNSSNNKFGFFTADNFATYGVRDHNTNNYFALFFIEAPINDNVTRGFRFEATSPFATIVAGQIQGTASHRIAVDIEVNGGNFANLYNLGINVANTVLTNSGTSHLLALSITGTLQTARVTKNLIAATFAGAGAAVTPANGSAEWVPVTVTDATAFTINAPSGTLSAAQTQTLTIEVRNSSGGAMGAITWNATYKFNGFTWTNPANGFKRWASFQWNGLNWVCIGVAGADY